MADIILGPIIGGLSHSEVKLWARADKASILYAWLATKSNLSDATLMGKTTLTASTGFAGVVSIKELKPAKKYFFALSLRPKLAPPKSAYQSFKTFPAPGKAQSFRFAFGSCFLPWRESPGQSFKHMLEEQKDLAFLLMLGDQIYADAIDTNGLGRVALNLNDYRNVYKTVWSNLHLHKILARTPTFMILDDHEVDNDWHWNDEALSVADIAGLSRLFRTITGRPGEERHLSPSRVHAALQVNWEHQVLHAPGNLSPGGPLAYEFEYGQAAFFIMDTRTQRFLNNEDRQLLGKKQWHMLNEWLMRVKETHPVKFIVSSISILSDLLGDWTDDRWEGFREERNRLLNLLAREGIEGVYFLAGDLHSAHAISADLYGPNGKAIPVWEFCSSPFEQKPNKFAWLVDLSAQSPALHNKKRYFTISEINYGVVEVDFTKKNPKVDFQLNYEKDGEWFVRNPRK
jgi:phosphodiesterase/alkaline phosphatase D-like protein